MRAKRKQDPGAPDPALDRYRRGVARASESGAEVGYLWMRVQVWWRIVGPFWARRWVDPTETPEWFLEFDERPDWKRFPFEDHVPGPKQIAATLADLGRGVVEMNGHEYELRWLNGEEAEAHPAPNDYWLP